MRHVAGVWIAGVLLLMAIVTQVGCSAGTASDKSPDAAEAGVEAIDPGGVAEAEAVEPEAEESERFSDNCHGILSCTFFGLGAVIALPFWVLGAALGLVF